MGNNSISKAYFIGSIFVLIGFVVQDFFKPAQTIGILCISLTWILTFNYKSKFDKIIKSPLAIAFIGIYIMYLLSMTYTHNQVVGWENLLLKVSILIFPVVIFSTNFLSQLRRIYLLKLFATLMVVTAAMDLTLSFLDYNQSMNSNVFYYTKLTHILPLQPHYISCYYSFAIFSLIYFIATGSRYRLIMGFAILLLLVSILLLSSRAYLLIFPFVSGVSFILLLKNNFLTRAHIFIMLSVFALIIVGVLVSPEISKRINDAIVELKVINEENPKKQTNPRVYLWKGAMDIISKKPLLGYGIGDAKEQLNITLKDKDAFFWNGTSNYHITSRNYNSHNQYLEIWAQIGVLGFLLIVFVLLYPFFLKDQHPLFLIFLALLGLGLFTESMLERQAGVVFFAFMYPLLSGLKKQQ